MEDVDEESERDVLHEDADKSVNDDKVLDLDQQQASSTASSKSNLNNLQRKSGPRFNQKLVSFFNRIFFGEEAEKKEHDNVEEQAGKEVEEEPPHLQLAQKSQLSKGENLKQSRIVETGEEQGGHNNFPDRNEVEDLGALAEDGEDGNTRSLSTSSAVTDPTTSQSYLNFLLNYGRWSSEQEQGMNSAKTDLIQYHGKKSVTVTHLLEFLRHKFSLCAGRENLQCEDHKGTQEGSQRGSQAFFA